MSERSGQGPAQAGQGLADVQAELPGIDLGLDPVLIVGAGPVGMTAALMLAYYGIRSIILDDDNKLSYGSRAMNPKRDHQRTDSPDRRYAEVPRSRAPRATRTGARTTPSWARRARSCRRCRTTPTSPTAQNRYCTENAARKASSG